jgi:antirestriction protein ArdC
MSTNTHQNRKTSTFRKTGEGVPPSSNLRGSANSRGGKPFDLRQQLTDRVIEMIEQGGLCWVRGWQKKGMPRNGKTGNDYRGLNVVFLWHRADRAGYSSNVWLTYKQAQELGGQVRKGEASVLCSKFDMVKKKEKNEHGEDEFYPMCKPFWLFNVAQIDGLPASFYVPTPPAFAPNEAAENIIADSGARFIFAGDQAFYSPAFDAITLPPRASFLSAENFYATALHELVHWTGSKTRLDRLQNEARFGSDAYAFEELVAELGAAMLGAEIGLTGETMANHAAYVDGWLKILKADKTAIFSAAKQASAAVDFLLNRKPQAMQEAHAA